MNWLSVLILAVPVLCVFNGIQRGMVRTAFSVLTVAAALILGSILTPFIGSFLRNEVPIYHIIQEKCQKSITETVEMKLEQQADQEEQNRFIEELPLPDGVKKVLIKNNNAEGYNRLLAESFGEYLSHSIAKIIVGAISWMLAFIVISILMNLLCGVLDSIFSLPVLSLVNRAGGAALGVIQGIFIIWLLYLVITLFWDASWAQDAMEMIMENSITGYLYQHNILLEILSNIIK